MKSKFILLIFIFLFIFCSKKDNPTSPEGEKVTNTSPMASFSVSPSSGTTETTFSFDAFGCFDSEDSLCVLQVRWDWESDGTWDTNYSTNKTANHKYSTEGTKTITLEVKDTGGLTNSTTKQISVTKDHGVETGTATDIDGNVYQTVKIGNQWWMAENLRVTRYRNGDVIPKVTSDSAWSNLSTGAYCVYDNDESLADTYGYLYNWYAVDDSCNLAPEGWHVPTDEEWKKLEMYLGMSQSQADAMTWRGTDEGGKMKEMGTDHWMYPNKGATNKYGFSALPGGYRYYDGFYEDLRSFARFWTSTEKENDVSCAWFRSLYFGSSDVTRYYYYRKGGLSVRCVKD